MRAFTLWILSNSVAKRVAVGCGIVMLVAAMLLVPASAEVVQAGNTCWAPTNAKDLGGGSRSDKNYVLDIYGTGDGSGTVYYLHSQGAWVVMNSVKPQTQLRDREGHVYGVRFGIPSGWADYSDQRYFWKDDWRWAYGYSC